MFPFIDAFFQDSEPECLVLVHPGIQQLKKAEDKILADYQVVCLCIGKELSSAVLTTPRAQRSRMARQWLEMVLREKSPGPILCSEVDLLFQPAFDLDPLLLFRQISRYTRLLVLWPGTYGNGVLTYAVPEHHHYRTWRKPQVAVMDLTGVSDALS